MLRHAEVFTTSTIGIINNNNNNNHVNNNNNSMEQQEKAALRQRHASDHSQQQQQSRLVPPPSQFYVGQNLYHKLLQDHSQANLQDFYRNPVFSGYRHTVQKQQQHHHQQQQQQQQQHPIARRDHPISKSFDNLSDTFSVSSDESENFIPRIIRPRRRRKKEKVRGGVLKVGGGDNEESSTSCLGSEKQWLPTGLLSAESSFDSRSEGSGSSEEEVTINSLPVRRKLATALSVPAYITSYAGSDYSSMTSSSDTPPSSSTDQLFDSDSAPSSPSSSSSSSSSSPPPSKPLLKQTKSTSCSYFRSPKVAQKGVGFSCAAAEGGEGGQARSRALRKTHSWAPLSSPASTQGSEFSLFSPGSSIDLLSGIRQNLSRLDLSCEGEN